MEYIKDHETLKEGEAILVYCRPSLRKRKVGKETDYLAIGLMVDDPDVNISYQEEYACYVVYDPDTSVCGELRERSNRDVWGVRPDDHVYRLTAEEWLLFAVVRSV